MFDKGLNARDKRAKPFYPKSFRLGIEGLIHNAAQWAKGIDARVSALEVRLLPDQQINQSQAGELALQVKTVASALEQRGQANGYQRVYAELYRRFTIASYKNLPQRRFNEAIEWLHAWYDEIADQQMDRPSAQ